MSRITRTEIVEDHPNQYMITWGRQGSNLRPRDYESPALTTELRPPTGLIFDAPDVYPTGIRAFWWRQHERSGHFEL